MRRSEKEISDRRTIDKIIAGCNICRIALARDNAPYMIPISFGYDGKCLYFHTAPTGKKIDYFLANPQVCFEFERSIKLVTDENKACKWSFSFQTVIGYGEIYEVIEKDLKAEALNQIMLHYSGKSWPYSEASIKSVRVWRLEIESLSGKQSK